MPDFNDLCQQIEEAYNSLEHTLGWRFLYCSQEILKGDPKVALITMNPGGRRIPAEHGWGSCEDGSAYLVERWKENKGAGESPLQVQIQRMFSGLGVPIDSALTGVFVPFRSGSWKELPRMGESVAFSERLWKQVFTIVSPQLVITIGKETYGALVKMHGTPLRQETVPAKWGQFTLDASIYADRAIVRLNHLSTYKVFCDPPDDRHQHTIDFIQSALAQVRGVA